MNFPLKHPLPLIDIDLLNSLVAIAETGSFTAAADQVFRTPSAISMQVKKLEELLGRPLFVRDSRSVALTADGEMLLTYARRILALNREAVSLFIAPEVAGVVRLGAPDDVSERFLPGMLRRFSQTHPGVTVDVVVETSKNLLDQLGRGRLDLTLVTFGSGIPGDIHAEEMLEEKIVWAGLKGGCASARTPLPVSVWEEGCIWRRKALEGLEAEGRAYRIAFQSAFITAQKAAILADLAVAPLPASAIGGQVVRVPEEDGLPDLGTYKLGLVVDSKPNAAVRAAAEHLRVSFSERAG
ncbi:MAG: LysR family transcriptional regulator [Notoacmeibacter sp.]|nr:LysR family transcriptional regulator [Notoacmeibacter sp.]